MKPLFSKEIPPMQATNFDLPAYLERIAYSGPGHADAATLKGIMRAQLFSIPFENLDVLAGRGVSLVPEDIVDKLVHRRRGGYCSEVNGLFAMALTAIGLPFRLVAARPMFYPARRPRTHMALVVQASGEDWLCDLGFGSYGLRAPMRLADLDIDTRQDDDRFKLTTHSAEAGPETVLSAWRDGAWAPQFGFDLWPQEWVDFAPANHLNSTHPDAIFVQKRLLVRHNPRGRSMLLGHVLTRVLDGQSTRHTLSESDVSAVLTEEFGIRLPR